MFRPTRTGVAHTFEVFDRLDSQLQGGVLVTNKDGARVLLEGRHGPHVVHALLDGFIQSEGFVRSCDQNHHLSGGQQRGQTTCKQEVHNLFKETMRPLTSLASMTVPTPTVRAMVGTLDRSLPKKRALATMVSLAKVFTLVLDTRLEPGSLNAMCPSGPIPAAGQESDRD